DDRAVDLRHADLEDGGDGVDLLPRRDAEGRDVAFGRDELDAVADAEIERVGHALDDGNALAGGEADQRALATVARHEIELGDVLLADAANQRAGAAGRAAGSQNLAVDQRDGVAHAVEPVDAGGDLGIVVEGAVDGLDD